MKAKPMIRPALSAAAVLLTLAGAALPAQAAVDCNTPSGLEQRRACEAAREGVVPLRRFAERTRNVYRIYVPDYVAAAEAHTTANAADGTKLATTK